MEWKDFFAAGGAFIGLVSALITALGTLAAYKLKKAEKPTIAGGTVKLLSLKEQRSLNSTARFLKILGYCSIVFVPLWAAFIIWQYDLGAVWIVGITIGAGFIVALYIFILTKIRGDLSKRRSRTKYDTTISVMAPYDIAFSKCNDAVLRLKARIVLLDFENGIIESERVTALHAQFILNVKITRLDSDRCSIYVESDATLPTVLFDFGMNARRVNRFVNELIQ
jgi:hypothetical protein